MALNFSVTALKLIRKIIHGPILKPRHPGNKKQTLYWLNDPGHMC
jgi:hypothetical protein